MGGGGLLFRFACPVVLWGGRGTADRYHWRVWGGLPVFWPHWVCPCSWHVCFPRLHCSGSRVLYRGYHVVPVFGYSTKAQTRLGLRFVPSQARAAKAARSLTSAVSQGAWRLLHSVVPASVSRRTGWVCLVSLLVSWSLAATLSVDVNHPESQEVFG